MKSNSSWRIRVAQILLGVAIVFALVVVRGTKAGNEPIHLTTDWSHHHVFFSAPHNLGQHIGLLSNPRYNQQLVRRNAERKGNSDFGRWHHAPENPNTLQGDWSMNMGTGATAGAGNYPAKFSFEAGTANCATPPPPAGGQPDFVVYNTSLAGVATAVAASQTVTFAGNGGSGTPSGTVIIKNGANTLTLTAAGNNTGNNFLVAQDNSSGNRTANALSLANRIVALGGPVGVTASSLTNVTTITATTPGTAGNSITLTGTMNGSNGVTFGAATLAGGMDLQATIGAFDNLYVNATGTGACTGLTAPTTYWAYNTSTTGAVVTSPVLSGRGDQVAFVQNTGTIATLVLIKWKANDGTFTAPTTLTNSINAGAYHTCVTTTSGPCMFTIAFSGADALDTNSSPFYDYGQGSDTLYVATDGGVLHKFTNVFYGSPAEAGAPWPVTLTAASVPTSPVFDAGAGKVFVADDSGHVYSVTPTGTKLTSAALVPGAAGRGFKDSPILDSTNGKIYLATNRTTGGGTCATANSAVIQIGTGFLAGGAATNTATIGACGTTNGIPVYSGNFDALYYGGSVGHLYVCGNAGGFPTLYQIGVTAAGDITAGAATAGPVLTTANATCSPITEFKNGAVDRIFLSVTASAVTAGVINCGTPAGGCIMSFNVTAGTVPATTSAHALETGGTSAIVVDGDSGGTGASQVYFTPLADQPCTTSGGTGGCAIQASQAGLL